LKLRIFLCIFRIYISSCNLWECWCLFSSISTTDKSTFLVRNCSKLSRRLPPGVWRWACRLRPTMHCMPRCVPQIVPSCAIRARGSLSQPESIPQTAARSDRFSRFYMVHGCDQQIDTHTLLHLWHWRWAASIHYCFASAVVATEFKQATASSSASCKIVRPPSNLINGHDSQYGPWSGGLHMSRLVTVSPHLYMEALRVPWPVRKRFNSDREQRVRSKPGCRELGSATIAQLVTEAWPVLFPLWVHVYRRQIQPGVMLWRKSLRWVAIG